MSHPLPPQRHPATPPRPDAPHRGATVIPDRVVARLAAHAAHQALAGLAEKTAAASAPSAQATVRAGTARLELTVDLPYPLDILATARTVQHHVTDQVGRLTGLLIGEVSLTVRHLHVANSPNRVR
ncbi:Asp23/Gls24 family envelope stress response protein [Kitasatospora sp. NPDC017646]|uniref:Asp23/Gls24 family envelope stress response protein n=1 Tax=Kitasatospora sp. NPDC017646 TaxID=3364024 RepID=UPI0037933E7A